MDRDLETNCYCGRTAVLRYETNSHFYKGTEIKVNNVPMYVCVCGEEQLRGPDAIGYSAAIKIAYEKGLSEIGYKEERS